MVTKITKWSPEKTAFPEGIERVPQLPVANIENREDSYMSPAQAEAFERSFHKHSQPEASEVGVVAEEEKRDTDPAHKEAQEKRDASIMKGQKVAAAERIGFFGYLLEKARGVTRADFLNFGMKMIPYSGLVYGIAGRIPEFSVHEESGKLQFNFTHLEPADRAVFLGTEIGLMALTGGLPVPGVFLRSPAKDLAKALGMHVLMKSKGSALAEGAQVLRRQALAHKHT